MRGRGRRVGEGQPDSLRVPGWWWRGSGRGEVWSGQTWADSVRRRPVSDAGTDSPVAGLPPDARRTRREPRARNRCPGGRDLGAVAGAGAGRLGVARGCVGPRGGEGAKHLPPGTRAPHPSRRRRRMLRPGAHGAPSPFHRLRVWCIRNLVLGPGRSIRFAGVWFPNGGFCECFAPTVRRTARWQPDASWPHPPAPGDSKSATPTYPTRRVSPCASTHSSASSNPAARHSSRIRRGGSSIGSSVSL